MNCHYNHIFTYNSKYFQKHMLLQITNLDDALKQEQFDKDKQKQNHINATSSFSRVWIVFLSEYPEIHQLSKFSILQNYNMFNRRKSMVLFLLWWSLRLSNGTVYVKHGPLQLQCTKQISWILELKLQNINIIIVMVIDSMSDHNLIWIRKQ